MNVELVQKYVAYKVALHDEIFEEIRRKTTKKNFTATVMNCSLKELPGSLKDDLAQRIRDKYGLAKHVPLVPKSKMTVGMWVRDLCSSYTVDDVMFFFAHQVGVFEERLRKVKIGSTFLTHPFLISLVEKLERLTGRTLLAPDMPDPLSYLSDDVTLYEIAKYFATSSEVILEMRKRYGKHHQMEDPTKLLLLLRKQALEVFRQVSEVDPEVPDKEILSRPLSSFWWQGYSKGDWDLVVYFSADEFGVMLPLPLDPNMTVDGLINQMVSAKMK